MSLTSFYTALTGLNSNALSINVIGNNLANINTTAYKTSKTSFAELLGGLSTTTATNGNPVQVGLGSIAQGVIPVFNQGSIAYTGRSTDAAISGNGFFVVSTGDGLGYSRAGSFGFNSAGELMNSEGFKVLGYPAVNGTVNESGELTPLVVQKGGALPPEVTTIMGITANLDSQSADGAEFKAGVQIFDSLGASQLVTVTFAKTGSGAWTWTATLPATATGGAETDPPVQVGTGALTFDSSGVLTSPATNPTISIAGLADGAANMDVTLELIDSAGQPRLTNYAATSSVSSTRQNGAAASGLRDISIDTNGLIQGIYDNGTVHALGQLALATFPNEEGLLKFKGNTFVAYSNSGEPSIGAPGTGGRGQISGSSLEQSNVDIATEFTNLIVAQRGYQANSRVITTTDQLYQEAINLIR